LCQKPTYAVQQEMHMDKTYSITSSASARSLGEGAGTGAGQARAGYLVRSIKVSTACITEVCGLRKQ